MYAYGDCYAPKPAFACVAGHSKGRAVIVGGNGPMTLLTDPVSRTHSRKEFRSKYCKTYDDVGSRPPHYTYETFIILHTTSGKDKNLDSMSPSTSCGRVAALVWEQQMIEASR